MIATTTDNASLATLRAFSEALGRLISAARREEWDEVQTFFSAYAELSLRVEQIDWLRIAGDRAEEVAPVLARAQHLTAELTSLSIGRREVLRESLSQSRYENGALTAYMAADG